MVTEALSTVIAAAPPSLSLGLRLLSRYDCPSPKLVSDALVADVEYTALANNRRRVSVRRIVRSACRAHHIAHCRALGATTPPTQDHPACALADITHRCYSVRSGVVRPHRRSWAYHPHLCCTNMPALIRPCVSLQVRFGCRPVPRCERHPK